MKLLLRQTPASVLSAARMCLADPLTVDGDLLAVCKLLNWQNFGVNRFVHGN